MARLINSSKRARISASIGLCQGMATRNFETKLNNMNKFKIVPISAAYAESIRHTMKDNFGHRVVEQIATGAGPCRVSLKPFKKGLDKRLLFTHSPFEIDNAFNQPGPVFINADEIEEYKDIHRFPPEIKANKESFPLTLIGYNDEQQMVFTRLVADSDVDDLIGDVFGTQPTVSYLHVRNAEACCFICKVERIYSPGANN